MVYTASQLSLAALELLVHLDPDTAPDDLTAFEIDVPDILEIERVNPARLPAGWRSTPDHPGCRAMGDAWLKARRTPILAVPSALVPAELNYLINVRHPDAKAIQTIGFERFTLDPRLIKPRRPKR